MQSASTDIPPDLLRNEKQISCKAHALSTQEGWAELKFQRQAHVPLGIRKTIVLSCGEFLSWTFVDEIAHHSTPGAVSRTTIPVVFNCKLKTACLTSMGVCWVT